MNYLFWLIASLCITSASCADNVLDKDLELSVSTVTVGDNNYPAFEGYIGIGKESSTTSLSFEYNFGKNTSIVGNKDSTDWGIECKDTDQQYNNSCKLVNNDEFEDFYYSSLYKFKKANLFLRFTRGAKFDVTDKQALPVQLVTGGKNWPLKSLGVLGLAPQGDFARYARNMFSDNTTLLFGYEASNPTVENQNLKFNNHVVLNPIYTDSNVALKLNLDSKKTSWNFNGDIVLTNTDYKFENANVCFSSINNELILVTDSIVMCDAVKSFICDTKDKTECTKDNAKIELAPDLNITFENHTFTFKGKDYVYFNNKNVVDCRFGDITLPRAEQVCSDDTEIGLGRLFFAYYNPALSFNKDNTATLTLIKEYKYAEKSSLIWIIVGIIAAVIVVGVVLFIVLKRQRDTADEHYTRDL